MSNYINELYRSNEYDLQGNQINTGKVKTILWFLDQTQDQSNAKYTAIQNIDIMNIVDVDTFSLKTEIAYPYLKILIYLLKENPSECKNYISCLKYFFKRVHEKNDLGLAELFIEHKHLVFELLNAIVFTITFLIKECNKYQQHIDHSFELIEYLVENKRICSKYYDAFYETLYNLLIVIKVGESKFLNWDENIVDLFIRIISYTHQLPPCTNLLFQ